MDAATVFGEIYANDAWTGGSGPGSAVDFCRSLVKWLNTYLRRNAALSMVDLGCGDCRWMPSVIHGGRTAYLGLDAVATVIERNRQRFSHMRFAVDDLSDVRRIPMADLYWMKDVLQHWPDDVIVAWLDRFFAAKPWAHLVVCNCAGQESEPRRLDARWRFAPLHGEREPLRRYSPELLFAWNGKHVYRLRAGHQRSGSRLLAATSDVPADWPQSQSRGA